MGELPEVEEMDIPVGPLELTEGLLQALTGSQGDKGTTHVTDLPSAIIGSILSRVPNPVDIASAFKACHLFWGVAQAAPFRLQLRPGWYQDGGSFVGSGDDSGLANRTIHDAQKFAAWTRAALHGIRCVMPMTQELDLAGCPILDDDVAGVLLDLRSLDGLVLDGCQKLTSSVSHALAMSVNTGPRVLSLQRCFGLGPAAAGNLMAAAAADGSRLQAILLSHLDRLDLPREPPSLERVGDANEKDIGENVKTIKSVGSSSPAAGLRILALHNCGNLGYSELVAIAESCPSLEVLMLGGSVDGLGLSRPDLLPQDKVVAAASALVGATELLSRLRILEITFFTATILQAVRDQVRKSVHVWDFCDKKSVAAAAFVVASLKSPNQSLRGQEYNLGSSEGLMSCQRFSPSECTYSNSEVCHSCTGDTDLQMTNAGRHFLSKSCGAQIHYPHQEFEERWDCVVEDVLMALRAGTNCSDMRRKTPLHVAAAQGEPSVVANLLSIGAAARGMKDSKGASALFVAAESGHASVCDHLLRGGADVLASNRAGETPLYIAALRGHSAAVEVMLLHCQDRGINWQDADVYGDGWTPLMAATLADRQDVGKVLLSAAEMSSSSASLEGEGQACVETIMRLDHGGQTDAKDVGLQSIWNYINSSSMAAEEAIGGRVHTMPRSATRLLDAQNRYGQTALHIAARQGSSWFVANLLHAGASVDIQDEYRLRAVDVARKQNHTVVENVLKKWGNEHKNVKDVNQASTSKKRSGTGKKATVASSVPTRGNLNHFGSSAGAGPLWVPINPSVIRESIFDGGSQPDSSGPTLEQELPSLPDSPTSIVPNWMLSSPPVSPRLEELPVVALGSRDIDDDGERGIVINTQVALGSEAG